jgi:hypothetical protein
MAPFDPIMTFAVDPGNCDRIYTLDSGGDLARFDGAGWESLGAIAHSPGPDGYFNYIRSVAVDPNHPEIIYAGAFGSGLPVILRSVDDGRTWEDVSYNHFRQSISQIDVSPHSGEVMVGGCSGTRVLPPPYPSSNGIYDKLIPLPSCFDGLENGDEGGIDCGGSCEVTCVQTDGGQDGGDAGSDPGPDAGQDAGGDSAVDAGNDGGDAEDAGADAGTDAGGDASKLNGGCGCGQSPSEAGLAIVILGVLFVLRLTRIRQGADNLLGGMVR